MRQLDANLDVGSGAENDQRRGAFKDDAITSVLITKPTVAGSDVDRSETGVP